MAQIVAKQGAAHTFILIDEYDVIIAERVAGLNLNRAINELKTIAVEQGLVIAEKATAPTPIQETIERGPRRIVRLTRDQLALGSDR